MLCDMALQGQATASCHFMRQMFAPLQRQYDSSQAALGRGSLSWDQHLLMMIKQTMVLIISGWYRYHNVDTIANMITALTSATVILTLPRPCSMLEGRRKLPGRFAFLTIFLKRYIIYFFPWRYLFGSSRGSFLKTDLLFRFCKIGLRNTLFIFMIQVTFRQSLWSIKRHFLRDNLSFFRDNIFKTIAESRCVPLIQVY